MKQLLFISLMLVGVAYAQELPKPLLETPINGQPGQYRAIVNGEVIWVDPEPDTTTIPVMLEIVIRKKACIHQFREGFKRGNQFWYVSGRNIKPLPKHWMVLEYWVIKD